MKITKFAMRPEVGNMKIYMSDILPGNPELSKYFIPHNYFKIKQYFI